MLFPGVMNLLMLAELCRRIHQKPDIGRNRHQQKTNTEYLASDINVIQGQFIVSIKDSIHSSTDYFERFPVQEWQHWPWVELDVFWKQTHTIKSSFAKIWPNQLSFSAYQSQNRKMPAW